MGFAVLQKNDTRWFLISSFYNIYTQQIHYIIYITFHQKMDLFTSRVERKNGMESIHFYFFESKRNASTGICVWVPTHMYKGV